MSIDTTSLSLPTPYMVAERSALERHLEQCRAAQGRMFAASVWAERAHGLVAPRFITTVGVVAMLMAASSWWN